MSTEVIDVDALSSDSDEIQMLGFRRNGKARYKVEELEYEGIAYLGFRENGSLRQPAPPPQHASQAVIVISSDESDVEQKLDSQPKFGPPPRKKRKISRNSHTGTPASDSVSRGLRHSSCSAAASAPRRSAAAQLLLPFENSEDFTIASLDLDNAENWGQSTVQNICLNAQDAEDAQQRDEDATLALQLAELSVVEGMANSLTVYTRGIQEQASAIFDWSSKSRPSHLHQKCQQAVYSKSHTTTQCSLQSRPSQLAGRTSCNLHPVRSVYQAPGDVNTVLQSEDVVIIASAVADGSFDDKPGPYNKEGSLGVWDSRHEYILTRHSRRVTRERVYPQRHFFTVNDIALDPTSSYTFASAGRDKRVAFWTYESLGDGVAPQTTPEDTIRCKDIPEVIKYRPGHESLAIQCNDGSVYVVHRSLTQLMVAPAELGHVTADMEWGVGPTDGLLFASSACSASSRGFHRAFDVTTGRPVMELKADEQACSTLALDPSGEHLYIATESPDSYILRQYSTREQLSHCPTNQHVELEPFPGNASRAWTDINCLSISSDGIYIAAGRMDNWLDVYDARMLRRGPLYRFAHEGRVGPDTYGVVKAQWVDGFPYGTGFVSGGVDGCIRLWDVKLASEDPLNGSILAQCDYDIATFTLGDMYKGEAPIVVGERSGKVTMYNLRSDDRD